jgi:hypothetical protein
MLALNSPRWAELQHAYGSASDTPTLLRELQSLPDAQGESEPWFSLWSSLAHQGDVYSASFAAVPHVVEALASAPASAPLTYFHFPAWVEICRKNRGVAIPSDLELSYFAALAKLPSLVAAAAVRPWDSEFTACALAAVAAAKGNPRVAEAVLELTPEVAEDFLEWFFAQ